MLVKGPPLVEAVLGGATPSGVANWPKIRPQNSTKAKKMRAAGESADIMPFVWPDFLEVERFIRFVS